MLDKARQLCKRRSSQTPCTMSAAFLVYAIMPFVEPNASWTSPPSRLASMLKPVKGSRACCRSTVMSGLISASSGSSSLLKSTRQTHLVPRYWLTWGSALLPCWVWTPRLRSHLCLYTTLCLMVHLMIIIFLQAMTVLFLNIYRLDNSLYVSTCCSHAFLVWGRRKPQCQICLSALCALLYDAPNVLC